MGLIFVNPVAGGSALREPHIQFISSEPVVSRPIVHQYSSDDYLLVDVRLLTVRWDDEWIAEIPKDTLVLLFRQNGQGGWETKIAETAQPLQVTGPVITTFDLQ